MNTSNCRFLRLVICKHNQLHEKSKIHVCTNEKVRRRKRSEFWFAQLQASCALCTSCWKSPICGPLTYNPTYRKDNLQKIPMTMLIDEMTLFRVFINISFMTKKRLICSIFSFSKAHVQSDIYLIRWIPVDLNIANGLGKICICPALEIFFKPCRLKIWGYNSYEEPLWVYTIIFGRLFN